LNGRPKYVDNPAGQSPPTFYQNYADISDLILPDLDVFQNNMGEFLAVDENEVGAGWCSSDFERTVIAVDGNTRWMTECDAEPARIASVRERKLPLEYAAGARYDQTDLLVSGFGQRACPQGLLVSYRRACCA
jgi:hypothetical protein